MTNFRVDIYNAHTEQDQLESLQNLSNLLENLDSYNKNVILAGDINLFFNKKLECKGERPFLKSSQ